MGILRRVKSIFLAHGNAMLNELEDPIKMTEQYITEIEDEIIAVGNVIAKQMVAGKQLENELKITKEMAAKREEQAKEALRRGNDELAKKALEDSIHYRVVANSLDEPVKKSSAATENLKRKLWEMKIEYDRLKVQKTSLAARAEAAKAQKAITEISTGISSGEARRGFERMKAEVEQLENSVLVIEELRGQDALGDELDALNKPGLDAEIERLRKDLQDGDGR